MNREIRMGLQPRGTVAEPRNWNIQSDEDFCVLCPLRALPDPVIQSTRLLLQPLPWSAAPACMPPASYDRHLLPSSSSWREAENISISWAPSLLCTRHFLQIPSPLILRTHQTQPFTVNGVLPILQMKLLRLREVK